MKSCPRCHRDLHDVPIFALCLACHTPVPLEASSSDTAVAHRDSTDTTLTLQQGKYERVFSLQEGFEHLYRRLEETEGSVEEVSSHLDEIERYLQINITHTCPECGGPLTRTEAGMLCCESCGEAFPERSKIGHS